MIYVIATYILEVFNILVVFSYNFLFAILSYSSHTPHASKSLTMLI